MAEVPIDTGRATWTFTTWLARGVVVTLFVLAALHKIGDLPAFAKDLRNYELFPPTWSNVLAYSLAWLELLAAALFLLGFWRTEARALLAALLVVFVLLKLTLLLRGQEMDCGCFGASFLTILFAGARGMLLNVGLLGCLTVEFYGDRYTSSQ